jgi:hypothetical protein
MPTDRLWADKINRKNVSIDHIFLFVGVVLW